MKYLKHLSIASILLLSGVGFSFACMDDSGDPNLCNYDGDPETACDYSCGPTVECYDGSLVFDEADCPTPPTPDELYTCPDESIVTDPADCGLDDPVTCPDGRVVENILDCDIPDPTICPNGDIVFPPDECPDNNSFSYCIYTDPTGSGCAAEHPDGNCYPTNDCAGGPGCTDPYAMNYDPSAGSDDGTCDYGGVYGCTDSGACNYFDLATDDDGSCYYDCYGGCTDPYANNYNPTALYDDGSCMYGGVYGCTDPNACNYFALATDDDGTCEYDSCGCTDPIAINYNPTASFDTGLCEYEQFCGYEAHGYYTYKGVTYEVYILVAYFFDPNTEACVPPDLDAIMAAALDPYPTPPPFVTTPDGITITAVGDQCPNIEGAQTYNDFMNGGYQKNGSGNCYVPQCGGGCGEGEFCCAVSNSCVTESDPGACGDDPTLTGRCALNLTSLSPEEVTIGQPLTGNIGCDYGAGTAVTTTVDPQGNPLYMWSCLGTLSSVSCTATVESCPAEAPNYCYGECTADTCEEPPEPCPNGQLCTTGGKVRLNPQLKVTPLVNPGGSCVVRWDKDAFGTNQAVILQATSTTRCSFADQDSTILTFDVVNPSAPTGRTIDNVTKDKNFVLKCWETNDPSWGVASSTGSCRLNIRQTEFN